MSYDEIGNLLYDGYYGYTWQHGRQLVEISAGFEQAYYSYDVNGMRLSRYYLDFYEGTPHNYTYVYNGSQLTQMTKDADTLYFAYDAAGMPLSFTCGTATYYYVTNLQGDVVAILDSTGTPVVSYTYNAWGKVLSVTGSMASTLGKLNPLTYRGYVYDWETGLYYLQSRYYNPEWGRFINADAFVSTGQGFVGNNMFAYCLNNPVNRVDLSGSYSIWYYLIIDSDMGFIHRAVVEDIRVNNSSVQTEVTLTNFGRADVVNADLKAVWEVKHAGKNPLIRTAIAYAQASAYVEQNNELTHLGNAGAFNGKIYIECMGLYYEVEYRTPQPGVILYTVKDALNYNGTVSAVYVPKKEI